jgi:micrococcal nuclease
VYLLDGRLLNRLLVEQGLAVVYRRFAFRMKEEFLIAESEARQSGVGLWAKGR